MRILKFLSIYFIIALSSLNSFSAEPQQPQIAPQPTQSNNVISMPWDAFMKLWVNAKNEDVISEKPAYGRFLFMGDVDTTNNEYLIHMTSKFDVTTYLSEEAMVPLLPNKMTLESLKINGKETPWTIKDGYYCAYLGGNSKHEIEANFTIKPEAQGIRKKLQIPFLGQARQEVVLFVPENNIQSYVDYGVSLDTIETDDGTQIHAYFRAVENASLIWFEKNNAKIVADENISKSLTTYARLNQDGVDYIIEANLNLANASINGINILVPENFIIDSIKQSGSVLNWNLRESDKKNYKLLRIISSEGFSGNVDIKISGLIPSLTESYIFSGLIPLDPNHEKQSNSFYWVSSSDKSYSILRTKDLEEQAFKEVQGHPFNTGTVEHYFTVSGDDPQIDLNVKTPQNAKDSPLKITSAEIISTLDEYKNASYQIYLKIQNIRAQFIPVKFLNQESLQSIQVNGKSTSVMKDSSGHYLVPLFSGPNEIYLNYQSKPKKSNILFQKLYLPDFTFIPENTVWNIGSDTGQLFVVSKNADKIELSNNLVSQSTPLEKWKSYLVNTSKKNVAELNVYVLSERLTIGIVNLLSIIIGLYLFWALTFFFERAYLPEALYKTRTFFLGTTLSLIHLSILLVFDRKFLTPFVYFITLSMIVFSLWQNKLVAKRFRILFQKQYYFIVPIILIIYFSFLILALIKQTTILMIIAPIFLILLHVVFLKTYPKLVEKKARTKILPHLILILCLVFPLVSKAQEIEPRPDGELKQGHVYMDWSIIEDLLKKTEKKELEKQKTAGLKYIFGTSKVTGDVSGEFAQIRIETPVQIMTDKWIMVPVVSEDQVVTEVSLDGEMIPLRKDGNLVFFQGTKPKGGISKLEVEILLPVEQSGNIYHFKTESDFFKGANVTLSIESDLKEATIFHSIWQKKDADQLKAALDASGIFEMNILPTQELERLGQEVIDPTDSSSIKTKIYGIIKKESVLYAANIQYDFSNKEQDYIKINVPEDIEVTDIKNCQNWGSESVLNGRQKFKIFLSQENKKKGDVEIHLKKKLDFDAGVVEIPRIDFDDIVNQSGSILLGFEALSETKIYSARGLKKLDPTELIGSQPSLSYYQGYQFSSPDYELKISRGPVQIGISEIPVIDSGTIKYSFDSKQNLSTLMTLNLSSQIQTSLDMELPIGTQIESLTAGGRELHPNMGGTDKLSIDLQPEDNPVFLKLKNSKNDSYLSVKKISLPKISSKISDLDVEFELQNKEAIVPIWFNQSLGFNNFIELIGIKSIFAQNANRNIIMNVGSIESNQQIKLMVLYSNTFMVNGILLVVLILLTIVTYKIPLWFKTEKTLASILVACMLILVIGSPLIWQFNLICIASGLLIRCLRELIKPDNSLIV